MEYVDYYKLLGVERGASQDEVAKAYKGLARKYHPDLNQAKGAEDKFKQVNEAYEVLKDPETRKRYDAFGSNWKHGAHFEPPSGFGGGRVHVNDLGDLGGFSDFFATFFGGGGGRGPRGGPRGGGGPVGVEDLFGGFGGGAQPGGRPARGSDVESEITVQLEDIYHARKLSVQLSGQMGRKRYAVKIPPGTRGGEKIRLSRQGMPGRGGVPGDLYLKVKVAPHDTFTIEGDDLVVDVPVNAWDAALGTRLPVPALDGEVQMTLPAGLASGQRLRLRGKGLPIRGGGQGDLYAELRIVVPTELSAEQRQLFLQLRAASPD